MSDNTPATRENPREGDVAIRPADRYRAYMRARAARMSGELGAEVTSQQIDKILTAETDEDIWNADAGGTIQAKDVIGLEVEIRSLSLIPSDRFEGSEYYGSMDATVIGGPAEILTRSGLSVGEVFVLQTGADKILAKVRAFEAKDRLPIRALIAGTRTQSGFDVLTLKPLPERTVTTK